MNFHEQNDASGMKDRFESHDSDVMQSVRSTTSDDGKETSSGNGDKE